MELVVAVARGIIAGVFAYAAVAKVRDRAGTRSALRGLGLPPGIDLSLAVIEAFTAFGLVMERHTPAAAWVALGLLVLFTGLVGVRMAQGSRAPCPCFGAARPEPIGARTLVRNLVLIAVAVVATGDIGERRPMIWVSAAATVAVIGWASRRAGANRSTSAR